MLFVGLVIGRQLLSLVVIVIPIQDLFNKIRWDKEFGHGAFVLGYYDRTEDRVVSVPFEEIVYTGYKFSFVVIGNYGESCSIPFHRVRVVYKDGVLIWSR